VYESFAIEEIADSVGIYLCANITRGFYNYSCFSCQDCFGCSGLRNKSILRPQQTVYQRGIRNSSFPKIIERMIQNGGVGRILPLVDESFRLQRDRGAGVFSHDPGSKPLGQARRTGPVTVRSEGLRSPKDEDQPRDGSRDRTRADLQRWSDYEPPFPKVEKTIPASKLPERIEDVPDDVLNWAIECEVTKKPFRIISQELEFYRKHRLPIPTKAIPTSATWTAWPCAIPESSSSGRATVRTARKTTRLPTANPPKFLTAYSPERPEKIYCEKCYAKEVLG
jgi:hypothetical protein